MSVVQPRSGARVLDEENRRSSDGFVKGVDVVQDLRCRSARCLGHRLRSVYHGGFFCNRNCLRSTRLIHADPQDQCSNDGSRKCACAWTGPLPSYHLEAEASPDLYTVCCLAMPTSEVRMHWTSFMIVKGARTVRSQYWSYSAS